MKRSLHFVIGILYCLMLAVSMIILVKTGASIFYKKTIIQDQNLTQQGNAFEYQFNINTDFYNPDTLMVLEDTHILEKSSPDYTTGEGKGTYGLKEIGGNFITVLFAPTTPSNPISNGHSYQVYIRPFIISKPVGGILLFILLLWGVAFIFTSVIDPSKRKVLLGSPFGIFSLWDDLFAKKTLGDTPNEKSFFIHSRRSIWKRSIVSTILIAYVYLFLEWIFIVTKPSFMDILNLGEKIKILLITGFAAACLGLIAILAMFVLDTLFTPVVPSVKKVIYAIPGAILASCLALIMIDNFTYTIFKFGIVNSTTLGRIVYLVIFTLLLLYFVKKFTSIIAGIPQEPNIKKSSKIEFTSIIAFSLCAISIVLALTTFSATKNDETNTEQVNFLSKPNIILLGTDGLNAENMSVYGYTRDTTPFIRELAKTSLISQNNFTNAEHSMGSDTALLTSKLPLSTRVLYPPDTLKGSDKYKHLPGLLRRNGYRTVELGVPYYVDANTINFQNAFDAVNCKDNQSENASSDLARFGYDDEIYFWKTLQERISDRLQHIFFITDMVNPMTQVTQASTSSITDTERLECLNTYLNTSKQTGQPLFAHIHLMGTHGSKFYPPTQEFSKGQEQSDQWMTNFYDDSILNFDTEVENLVQTLKDNGQYDETILVIYTDHGEKWTSLEKIPLIIHFPNDQYSKNISENTQNIDVGPTILEYLGIQKPEWMEGNSLLQTIDSARLIVAGGTNKAERMSGKFALDEEQVKPPFYQFTRLSIIQCQRWYQVDLENMTWDEGEVSGYVNPCPVDTLDSQSTIRKKVGDLLTNLGYKLPDNW